MGRSHLIKQSVQTVVDFAPSAYENKLIMATTMANTGSYDQPKAFSSNLSLRREVKKVYTMRSVSRFLSVGALALLLVPLGRGPKLLAIEPEFAAGGAGSQFHIASGSERFGPEFVVLLRWSVSAR